MTNLYEIRQKAQQAEGIQISTDAPSAFIGTGGNNYKAIYRAVYEYHEKHNPPYLTLEYWRSATEINELAARFNNDPFAMALLSAVYSELEREYILLKAV